MRRRFSAIRGKATEGETGIKAKEKGETPSRLEVARPKSIRIGLAGSWGVVPGCSPGLRETRKETGREGYWRRGYSLELATAKYDNILTALAPRSGSFSATGGPFQLQKKLLLRNEIIPQPLSIRSIENCLSTTNPFVPKMFRDDVKMFFQQLASRIYTTLELKQKIKLERQMEIFVAEQQSEMNCF
ncbi:hypothetical protein K0M31_012968 [Melipona bicolor]|uniref:Uncharacterized protein n=1 Tax=Melipona bicolor TaxID=60889 RepID=A0AA40FIT2_9HYME|nr:hypothetical protein K0M31_012968 [Melipona bicolor]